MNNLQDKCRGSLVGVAVFSDDTQMSLFTAEGLLNGRADGAVWDTELLPYIRDAYIRSAPLHRWLLQ